MTTPRLLWGLFIIGGATMTACRGDETRGTGTAMVATPAPPAVAAPSPEPLPAPAQTFTVGSLELRVYPMLARAPAPITITGLRRIRRGLVVTAKVAPGARVEVGPPAKAATSRDGKVTITCRWATDWTDRRFGVTIARDGGAPDGADLHYVRHATKAERAAREKREAKERASRARAEARDAKRATRRAATAADSADSADASDVPSAWAPGNTLCDPKHRRHYCVTVEELFRDPDRDEATATRAAAQRLGVSVQFLDDGYTYWQLKCGWVPADCPN